MCQSKAQGGRRCSLHQRGTRALLNAIRAKHDLDREQADAIFRKAHDRAQPRKNDPTRAEWNRFVDDRIERLALDLDIDPVDFDRITRQLHHARIDVPDARTFAALQDLDLRAQKAISAIRRQVEAAAALRGVQREDVEERFRAYRDQYRKELSHLPAAERPDPPAEWLEGFTTKDMMAVSAPADRATLYAIYRCQADPDAFGGVETHPSSYVSIDLETAGPSGKEGFNPENGSIIEVGIVEYDAQGAETDRYSQLIAPASDVAEVCGTGAVEVHGITMDDLVGAPTWQQVAPVVAARLNGRVMMAQNARFENAWLQHHMSAEGHDFDRWGPTVDTMCIARQHAPGLANHQLSTICASVGVEYVDGHRALHDAEVAGRAFFALRAQIAAIYLSSPARAKTPQPAPGSGRRAARRASVSRLTVGDFAPDTVEDLWAATPRPNAAAGAA